jgi:hypothetical protein
VVVLRQAPVRINQGQGRYRDAQPLQEKLLALRRKVLGEEHSHIATSYGDLAANQYAQGRYREAEEGFRKAFLVPPTLDRRADPRLGGSPLQAYRTLVPREHEGDPRIVGRYPVEH